MRELPGYLRWLRDDDLPAAVSENDADRPWWGQGALALATAAAFFALWLLFRDKYLSNMMPGDFNAPATGNQLAWFLGLTWVFIVAGWHVGAAYKRGFMLLASIVTVPVLIPWQAIAAMLIIALALYALVAAAFSKTAKWAVLVGFWTLFFIAWRGNLAPLIVPRNMHLFAQLGFFALFLKSLYYLFEKTNLLAGKPEAHPVRNYLLYMFGGPFFLNPFHIKPIGYAYMDQQFGARPRMQILRDGVILFGQGILYLLLHAHVFSLWLDWRGPQAVQALAPTLPGWQILLFMHFNFLKIFLVLAGNVYLIVGIWRLFGFDLKADFYYPFFAKNLLEHWRRWNIYNRDFVVALVFNPVLLKTGRAIGRYWAYMLACILTFFIGLGVVVHLIPTTFYWGNPHFAYPILVRSGLLGVLTGLNIWLDLFLSQKGRKKKLRALTENSKMLTWAVRLVKIYFTFLLMSCIYMIQQGLTSGLKFIEVLRLILRVVY